VIVGNWMLLPPGSAIDGLILKNTSRSINCCCCCCLRARSSPWCTVQQFDRFIKNDAAAVAAQRIVEWRATWCARWSFASTVAAAAAHSEVWLKVDLCTVQSDGFVSSGRRPYSLGAWLVVDRVDLDHHQISVDRLRQDDVSTCIPTRSYCPISGSSSSC